ncbi:MAG: response regulator transcription factor [Chloroflexi bacterium]|nr:response regulator transcription factor [Chloroflexota bacterium]
MTYILILGIDHDLRVSVVDLLQVEGFEAVVKGDSSDGVARVMQGSPALLIMSEDMLPLDGVELLPLLRRLTASPIIVVGAGGETAVVKALLQGADMYISRPINYRELLSRVRALLRMSSQGNDIILSEITFSEQERVGGRREPARVHRPTALQRQVIALLDAISEAARWSLERSFGREIQPA